MRTVDLLNSFAFWAGVSMGLIAAAMILNIIAIVLAVAKPQHKPIAIGLLFSAMGLVGIAAAVFLVDYLVLPPHTVG